MLLYYSWMYYFLNGPPPPVSNPVLHRQRRGQVGPAGGRSPVAARVEEADASPLGPTKSAPETLQNRTVGPFLFGFLTHFRDAFAVVFLQISNVFVPLLISISFWLSPKLFYYEAFSSLLARTFVCSCSIPRQ